MKKLDIGCGTNKVEGCIGLDFHKVKGVDVVHDLNKIPYPFKDNTFDEIYANHILEHLTIPLDDILSELCRITKPKGKLKIRVPHALSVGAFTDPTHVKFFAYFTFDYFGSNVQSYYTKARVKIIKRRFIYEVGNLSSKLLKPMEFLVNLFPLIYTNFFAFIFPTSSIYFELEPIKTKKVKAKK